MMFRFKRHAIIVVATTFSNPVNRCAPAHAPVLLNPYSLLNPAEQKVAGFPM